MLLFCWILRNLLVIRCFSSITFKLNWIATIGAHVLNYFSHLLPSHFSSSQAFTIETEKFIKSCSAEINRIRSWQSWWVLFVVDVIELHWISTSDDECFLLSGFLKFSFYFLSFPFVHWEAKTKRFLNTFCCFWFFNESLSPHFAVAFFAQRQAAHTIIIITIRSHTVARRRQVSNECHQTAPICF